MTETATMDLQEQIARIDRANAETGKLVAEAQKLIAEAGKLTRDTKYLPIQMAVTIFAAGGGLVAATVALMKALGA
ncbi:MAG: hypothetical protein ACAH27_05525 [Xanthobacteraceae bacterium]